MRLFGSLKELVRIAWRVDSNLVNLDPNAGTTYTAERTFQLAPGDSSQVLVSETATQTLSGKTIDGDDNTVQDLPDTALKTNLTNANKFFTRDGSGIPTSAAKDVPTGTVVGTTDTQTLTNKSVHDATFTIQDEVDTTKQARFQAGNISTATTRTYTFPNASTTLLGTDAPGQTISNKTLDATNTYAAADTLFTLQDDGDSTKQAQFNLANISASTLRVFALPDANTTLVGTDTTQTLTNKTIAGGSNTISGLLHGTQVDNPSSGVHGVTGSVVGTTDTQTLSSKTLTSPELDTPLIDDYAVFNEESAPGTSAAGTVRVYAKSDGKMYSKDDAGVETGMFGGSGASESVHIVTNADYTITDSDGYTTILVSTGNTTRTITLPTLADNLNRRIRIKKIDSGTGFVQVDGEGTENLDGKSNFRLCDQYDFVIVQNDEVGATEWHVIDVGGTLYSHLHYVEDAGRGSTNTRVAIFGSQAGSSGQALTHTGNSTDGSLITINKAGLYAISATGTQTLADNIGIVKNESANNDNFGAFTTTRRANVLATSATNAASMPEAMGCTEYFEVGDVVQLRSVSGNTFTNTGTGIFLKFFIRQVTKN